MCTSLLINTDHSRKSFTVLPDDDSMTEHFDAKNLKPVVPSKIKSIYHQNCIIPNEDFSILYHSIASKFQPSQITLLNKNLYSPSKEFFNKVSSKLRELHPKVTQIEYDKDPKMERPMFITTVKTGTFLEPPPEVAALLGLRKNSFSNTNSSTSSTGKVHSDQNMVYSFASKPRIVKSNLQTNFASRSLFRVENRREKREITNELPKITNDTSDGAPTYGNTMYDRRVARGSNFASQRPNVISTEHVLSRQAEARRRAAVRQRAQIRARKLRLGTPPPIDGRKHGQIQTDRFLEELSERPPDKSIACQADLPVQHNSPVPSLDLSTSGVEAATQIYPGDLPDIDDEFPSIVTSMVNKILREAILEINDELEVIKLRNLASERKRANANVTEAEGNGVISKSQLNLLIQQAIDNLKQSQEPDSADKNLDDINSNQLLEKIFEEIKNMVTDVKFLSGIIKTHLDNWIEESNPANETESAQAENDQSDKEDDKASNAETVDLQREITSVDERDNESVDNDLDEMNAEIDDYKTDDFEEESKDLSNVESNQDEVSEIRNDLGTNPNSVTRDNDDVVVSESAQNNESGTGNAANEEETALENGSDSSKADNVSENTNEINDTRVATDESNLASESNQVDQPDNSIDTNRQNETVNSDSNSEPIQNTDSETNKDDQEVHSDLQPETNNRQNTTQDETPTVTVSQHEENEGSDDAQPSNTAEFTLEENPTGRLESSNAEDQKSEESATSDELRESEVRSDSAQNNAIDSAPESNNEREQPPEAPPQNDTANSESSTSAKASEPTLTIPTLNMSLLDPPINDSNSEDDITIDDPQDQPTEQENPSNNNTANNNESEITQNQNDNLSEDKPEPPNTSENDQTLISNDTETLTSDQIPNTSEQPNNAVDQTTSSTPTDSDAASSDTATKPQVATANEDDNDVVSTDTTTVEQTAANQDNDQEPQTASATDDQTASNTNSANLLNDNIDTTTESTTSSDIVQEAPSDNNQPATDISERSSSALQDKPSDTESVENNELQSSTSTSEDANTSQNSQNSPSNDEEQTQESEKPLNTDNVHPETAEQQLKETNQQETVTSEPTATVDREGEPSNSTNTPNNSERSSDTPSQNESTELANSANQPNVEINNTEIDAQNNDDPEVQEPIKSPETNNNDLTIQSKNPTAIVQNGNVIANR